MQESAYEMSSSFSLPSLGHITC